MPEKFMGSDLISAKEAGAILGLTPRSVHHQVRQGILHPQYPRGRKLNAPELFSRAEVEALAEVRAKGMGMPQLTSMAVRSYATSRALERRVEVLEQLLGADTVRLPTEEGEVHALYLEACDVRQAPPAEDVRQVMRWTGIFIALGEEYLDIMEHVTGDTNVWQVLMDVGAAFVRDSPIDKFPTDKELEAAYGYLQFSRKNLRQVCYFHVRQREGPHIAGRLLSPGSEDMHAGVFRLLASVFGPATQ